jgi:hypothetical protein
LVITEKRTSIEVTIVNEHMEAAKGVWRWANALQQVADGLTKVSARQHFVEILRKSRHAIRYDASFTAGKKLTGDQKEQYERYLQDEANVVVSVPEHDRCCKTGCPKPREQGGHRYCSRRIFQAWRKRRGSEVPFGVFLS